MADNVYLIDVLANTMPIVSDDGDGIDWIEFSGPSFGFFTSHISLRYLSFLGIDAASASYTTLIPVLPRGFTFVERSLLVYGVIENARGTNGLDSIQGSDLANVLYGDHAATGAGGNDTISGFFGNDTIYGGSANDLIYGDEGADQLRGGAGADSIYGGFDNDKVYGGSENDLIYGGAGIDVLTGDAGADSIDGGLDNDKIYGGSGNDVIDGGGGANLLNGGEGDDFITGRSGKDTMIGGAGADHFTGDWRSHSMVSYTGSNVGVNIELNYHSLLGTGWGGDAAGDEFLNVNDVTGSNFNDSIISTVDNNPGHPDYKNGFYGGGGDDYLYLGNSDDYASGGSGNDYIDLGFDQDRGVGGLGNDTIYGGEGDDVLYGGDGNDWLYGDEGDTPPLLDQDGQIIAFYGTRIDNLYGGFGADNFVFDTRSMGDFVTPYPRRDTDVIHDFKRAQGDHINLTLIDADLTLEGLQSLDWIGSSAFSQTEGQVRVMNSGADTIVQIYADYFQNIIEIRVKGINNMIESDFILA